MAIKDNNAADRSGFNFAYILAALIVLGIIVTLASSVLRPGNGGSQDASINERLDRMEDMLSGIDVMNDRLSSLDRQITEFQIALTERLNSLESYMSQKISSANKAPDNLHTEAVKPDKKPLVELKTPVDLKPKGKTQYHQVKAGETLYRISLRYNLTVDELKRLNNLAASSVIHVGQKLKVSSN